MPNTFRLHNSFTPWCAMSLLSYSCYYWFITYVRRSPKLTSMQEGDGIVENKPTRHIGRDFDTLLVLQWHGVDIHIHGLEYVRTSTRYRIRGVVLFSCRF